MDRQPLGRTGLPVTPIAFGAFKIGRNTAIKYPQPYPLPDEQTAATLLNTVLDLGINLIDTAPAYGLSEQRIGRAIAHRRHEFILCTKAGETHHHGQSHYDYSADAITHSIRRSLKRLHTDVIDIALIHSDGRDEHILTQTDAAATLQDLRHQGLLHAIGFSGKTPQGALAALAWADVVMVPYHAQDTSHAHAIDQAAQAGVGVLVKKALASGRLEPESAIRFVLQNPHVHSLVLGSLNPDHLKQAIHTAQAVRPTSPPQTDTSS